MKEIELIEMPRGSIRRDLMNSCVNFTHLKIA